jgi:signal transduction histidine kinase
MKPLDDVRVTAPAERALEMGGLAWRTDGPDDTRAYDARIPVAVAAAFRRAVARVRSENNVELLCDILPSDASRTLASICDAVREAFVGQRVGPIGAGVGALQVFDRLHRAFVEELYGLRKSLHRGELSRALAAFDEVRAELDRDETQRFLAALQSGEALDLLIEIAHDMRSPLTAILMLTETLRRPQNGIGEDVQSRQLALVYSAAFGLNALVNDVIALARGGDRLMDRDPVPFSTAELMQSVADIVRPIAEERKLTLTVTTPAVDARIGQPIALGRVLLNLASNALKYTSVGEVAITAVDLCPTHVRFEVSDTGPGIAPEVMPALFEPFSKRSATPRTRRFSSTGLGLAICRKLLRDMGSELRVESKPGCGTRFFFELTLDVAADHEIAEPAWGPCAL